MKGVLIAMAFCVLGWACDTFGVITHSAHFFLLGFFGCGVAAIVTITEK